ncbi:plasmid partitioning protein RepB [Jiella mangrovi]|uniref:Plasmid partitioning protein RepB n=1 Tax=Jiella mangrovi TaxID=2821407 RepID=A0ABS4BPK9_9HYPH|nr:plasmid partitioning protein RepB [Jiella mangrovi]MBP0618171.1 plasmid partitioning protein RepB [Jiella mangrovi]
MSKASERAKRMKAMFSEAPSAPDETSQPPARSAPAGAVRSLESSLSRIEQENEALRRRIAEEHHVVDLDPQMIEASFVQDRLVAIEADTGFGELIDSIREHGQQVPILVRAHPKTQGRYQIAYGHRRWRACAHLGRSVRAIVTDLSDEEMVVALGKENTERKDLTFIEQALFASELKRRNYKRETIAAALSLPPTNVSKLTKLAEAVPREIIEAIGPAPKIGRPRWEALAKVIEQSGVASALASMTALIEAADWIDLDSNARFARFYKNYAATPREPGERLFKGQGVTVLQNGSDSSATFRISDPNDTGLVAHLRDALPGLVEAYLQKTGSNRRR